MGPFRQNKVRAGFSYTVNMFNVEAILQVPDNRQLNPAIHTVDCRAKAHYASLLHIQVR
jgi:hypothetical protein